MHLIIPIAAYALLLVLLAELMRRWPRITGPATVLLPVLIPIQWSGAQSDLFAWLKMFSVAVGVLWLHVLRLSQLGSRRWARGLGVAVLLVNMSEAVAFDAVGGNYVNVAAGLLLIGAGFRTGARAMSVDPGPHRDLLWDVPLSWVVAYSVWDLAFIHGCYPEFTGGGIAVLGAALVFGVIRPALYLQYRGLTLYLHMVGVFSWSAALDPLTWHGWEATGLLPWLTGASLALAVAATLAVERATGVLGDGRASSLSAGAGRGRGAP